MASAWLHEIQVNSLLMTLNNHQLTKGRDDEAVAQVSTTTVSQMYSIFDQRQKWLIVLLVSTAGSFSGFASNIYFPALPTIAHDLNVSIDLINLTVTSYLTFQGLAPSLWGPVSDVRGRRVAYFCTFIVFFGACIGLAKTKNYPTLVILRCLQSTGSASTIAIGSGVIGDITTRAERGGFMGVFQAGLLLPVVIGPIIGGALAESLGWRSIFWFLTVYSGVFLLLLAIFLPETLRSIVANGNRTPSSPLTRYPLVIYQKTTATTFTLKDSEDASNTEKRRIDLLGPLRILFSRQAAPIITFLAVYYAVWQMSITAMSSLFETHYGLSEAETGLTFIANGAGSVLGTLVTGRLLNFDYHHIKAEHEAHTTAQDLERPALSTSMTDSEDNFPLEKARLRIAPVLAAVQCLSILVFGWTIQCFHNIHIAVPIASTFFIGWAAISVQSVVMTYLVDVYPDRSAAASASLNLARCLLAAGGTSLIMPMANGIGVGLAFTVCAALQFAALVGVALQRRLGGRWRLEMERKRGAGVDS